MAEVVCVGARRLTVPTLQVVGFPKLYVSALLRGLSTCVVPSEMLEWYVKGSSFKEAPRPEETNQILIN